LENARLFADTQRRAEQLATINRIGLSINSDLDLAGVLDALYEDIQRVLEVDSFYVALYDAGTGMIEFPLLVGEEGPLQVEPRHIQQIPGLTGYVIQLGQSLHLRDAQSVPEDAEYGIVPVDEDPTRSYIGVPLTFRDRVTGVLSVQSRQPNAYSQEDVELLETIATQASTAIENARAYERLAETAEELREIDRFKTQFLANMSHELRTPLNSIIGFSRVMLKGIDGPLTGLQEADLNSIYNSGQHLLALINSILDMSKIEAGKMELSFEEVYLPDVLNAVISTTKALVKDRPIQLRVDVPEDLPTVWADDQRVRQVLLNLVSNAAKFTEEGYIALKAEAGPEFVTITVTDTGAGIDPEAQSRLFIPFQQVDGSTTRRAGGTGLGLAISRSFVEMQGGEIWVESAPGEGATFGFTLPIHSVLQKKRAEAAELEMDPDKKAVLAIDDDSGVITLLKRYLENDGYQVVGITDPLHAVPSAERLAPGLTAITLDVVMPNSDGWQVLRALKQNPATQNIPVILCSIVEGVEQGLNMGAAACLRKPITRDEILEALRKVER
jgi:signal transduction histidine kinase